MMEQNTQNKMTKSSSQVVHTGDEVIHKGFPQIAQIHDIGFPQITQIHADLSIEILLTSSSHR
jgi:hypothetical protein